MPVLSPNTQVAAVLIRRNGLLLLVLNTKRGAFNLPMTKMREVLAEDNGLGLESGETAAGRVAVEVLGPRPFPRSRLLSLGEFEKTAKSDVTGEVKRYNFHLYGFDLPSAEEVQGEIPMVWCEVEQILMSEPIASIAGDILKQTSVTEWLANKRPRRA